MRGQGTLAKQLAPAALFAALTLDCSAATLTVKVVDEHGMPISGTAVHATSAAARRADRPAETPTAVMDQVDSAFVPHLLVVEKGTAVTFPNSDSVSHHVYSFSDAKRFELGLYKGDVYPPVQFATPGIVVLGCNIHDGMLGYIVVVDTPHFAVTGPDGAARLDGLEPGEYAVDVWTPRARPSGLPDVTQITIGESPANETTLTVRGKLAPDHPHAAPGLSWHRY